VELRIGGMAGEFAKGADPLRIGSRSLGECRAGICGTGRCFRHAAR